MEYGTIKIKLDELIKKEGISKNKLSHRAEMQRSQINNYCNNSISRLDTDVLARICTVLDCDISDLLEFAPPENNFNTQVAIILLFFFKMEKYRNNYVHF